jgi:hypothetical protein
VIRLPIRVDPTTALDGHITDLGGLIALALALVTVFTTVRATRAAARKRQEGLTRDDMLGELILDIGLLVLTVGVVLAATPFSWAPFSISRSVTSAALSGLPSRWSGCY